jgi:hypothetical protein
MKKKTTKKLRKGKQLKSQKPLSLGGPVGGDGPVGVGGPVTLIPLPRLAANHNEIVLRSEAAPLRSKAVGKRLPLARGKKLQDAKQLKPQAYLKLAANHNEILLES